MARSAALAEAAQAARKRLEDARDQAARALAEMEKLAAPDERPDRVNAVLTSLARDLEGADSPPTDPQRAVLQRCHEALNRYESRWKAFRMPNQEP